MPDRILRSDLSIPRCYSVEDPQTSGLDPAMTEAASPAGPFLAVTSSSSSAAARRSSTSRGLGASLQANVRNSRSLSFADGTALGAGGGSGGGGGPQQKHQLQVSGRGGFILGSITYDVCQSFNFSFGSLPLRQLFLG